MPPKAKSRFQRAKEAAEAKQRQHDAEAASIYESFVASFEAGGGEDERDQERGRQAFVREGEAPPPPPLPPPGRPPPPGSSASNAGTKSLTEMRQMLVERRSPAVAKAFRAPPELPRVSAPPPRSATSEKRQIDAFLEEIKGRQEQKGASTARNRAAAGPPFRDSTTPQVEGSRHDGDPTTTNLWVGNLNPNTAEDRVNQAFSRFGEVISVKIMWPRTEEQRRRGHNNGFVSYWRREDAEAALQAMNDSVLDGYTLMVKWGKALNKLRMGGQAIQQSVLGRPPPTSGMTPFDKKVKVYMPRGGSDRISFIDRLARYVAEHGRGFEEEIKRRERGNPDYAFLFAADFDESVDAVYYRWRTLGFVMGDEEDVWREEPYQLTENGPYWVPPTRNEARRARMDSESECERDGRGPKRHRGTGLDWRQLRKDEELHFRRMLGELRQASRGRIAEAMSFALENADASRHVVTLLKGFLVGEEKEVPPPAPGALIARLYLASDVLHNASAPIKNASSYRTLLQECLPEIFENLGSVFKGIEGRMKARAFEERVTGLIAVWERWSLFPPLYMSGLEATFLGAVDVPNDSDGGDPLSAAAAAAAKGQEHKESPHYALSEAEEQSLYKRARDAGIYTGQLSPLQVLAKLDTLKEFVKRKAAQAGLTAAALPAPAGDFGKKEIAEDDHSNDVNEEDLDGVPLPLEHFGGGGGDAEQDDEQEDFEQDDDDDDDDDIDGVPLA